MTDLIAELKQWCLSQRESLAKGLELMEGGVMHTREQHRGGQIIDTTESTIQSDRDNIAELEQVLSKIERDHRARS